MEGFDTISSTGAGLQPTPLYFLLQNMGSGYKPEPAKIRLHFRPPMKKKYAKNNNTIRPTKFSTA